MSTRTNAKKTNIKSASKKTTRTRIKKVVKKETDKKKTTKSDVNKQDISNSKLVLNENISNKQNLSDGKLVLNENIFKKANIKLDNTSIVEVVDYKKEIDGLKTDNNTLKENIEKLNMDLNLAEQKYIKKNKAFRTLESSLIFLENYKIEFLEKANKLEDVLSNKELIKSYLRMAATITNIQRYLKQIIIDDFVAHTCIYKE